MANTGPASSLIVTIQSRALKRTLGPLAWAVLEDVTLDAAQQGGRWLAVTSTRLVADHLGLTPGTVARALARLCTEGLVRREDRRDTRTGRFGESVYVVAPIAALLPCVDSPHTVRCEIDTPNTACPDTVPPDTALPSEAPSSKGDPRPKPVTGRRPGSSGRRRAGSPEQQRLLGDDESAAAPTPLNPLATTTTKAQQPNDQTPTAQNPKTQDPKTQDPKTRESLNPTTQRPTDSCQLFEQALPGAAAFSAEAG